MIIQKYFITKIKKHPCSKNFFNNFCMAIMILLMLLLNFFAAAHFSCILPCFVFQSHALLLLLLRLRIFPVVFPYILSSSSSSSLSSLCPSIFNFTSISLSLFRVIREQNVKRMMICCVMISLKACLSCFARSHIYIYFSVLLLLLLFFLFALSPFLCLFTRPSLLCLVLHTTYTFIKDSPSLPPHFAKNLIVHVIVYFSAMNKDAGLFFVL